MIGDIRIPYARLRTPSSAAEATAEGRAAMPPAPRTPMNANCDPPVNISRLSTQVCQTPSPDATASAPNEMPYALAAMATPSPSRHTSRTGDTSSRSVRSTDRMISILNAPKPARQTERSFAILNDMDLRERIAHSLRREREATGISVSELARRAGVSKATVSQLESGAGNPSVETLW